MPVRLFILASLLVGWYVTDAIAGRLICGVKHVGFGSAAVVAEDMQLRPLLEADRTKWLG